MNEHYKTSAGQPLDLQGIARGATKHRSPRGLHHQSHEGVHPDEGPFLEFMDFRWCLNVSYN